MNAFEAIKNIRAAKTAAVVDTTAADNTLSPREKMIKAAQSRERTPIEADRIAALPSWDPESFALDLTDEFKQPGGKQKLRPKQSAALHWARTMGGLLAPLEVGGGKTLISLLCAPAMNAQRPVLLLPPTMEVPLRREMARLEPHWKIPKNLLVIPYSKLSQPNSSRLLEEFVRPDLIIMDECHCLRNPDAARTKRVIRYLKGNPEAKVVALSGTMTTRGLRDYAHISEWALKAGSPVPRTLVELLAWAACLDADGDPKGPDWDLFAKFCDVRDIPEITSDRDETTRRAEARKFFQQRLTTTPGVVSSTADEQSVGASLIFREQTLDVPDEVTEALEEMRTTWTRPDGEELVTALDYWRCSMQLAQGFYYYWDWPKGIVDGEWMGARSRWHKMVRLILQSNVPDMDSPLLVYRAVESGVLDDEEARIALEDWKKVKDRKKPPTATKWISNYLVMRTAEWHLDNPSGLIWQSDKAMEYALREAGIPSFGPGEIPDDDGVGKALSIQSHGTGLNLQTKHANNLIINWPGSGKVLEQLIGRTHRSGQTQDEVSVDFFLPTPEALSALRKSRDDARYMTETMGSPQKLLYGTWLMETVADLDRPDDLSDSLTDGSDGDDMFADWLDDV